MIIDFSEKQLALLKELLAEYAEGCYQAMFEYKHTAVDAPEDFVRREYSALAESEEARFNDTRALLSYIEDYERLMKARQ